jgi:predicted Na+-dependent transporter
MYLPLFSVITMMFIIAMELYSNIYIFANLTTMGFVIASVLAVTGFSIGAGIGYITRQSQGRIITLALETGLRTSYITNLCVTMTYSAQEANVIKTMPVLCSLLTLVPSFAIVVVYRIRKKCKMLKEDIALQEEHVLAKECLSMMNHKGDLIEDTELN